MFGRTVALSLSLWTLGLAACAGFRSVDRAEWVRVYADPADRAATAKQELIARDRYEAELAAGTHRAYQPLLGWQAPFLHQTDAIKVAVGDVAEFLVDESKGAEVQLNGSGAELFLTSVHKRDDWKDGTDVTHVESSLFLRGTRAGTGTLRLVTPGATKDIPVTVGP